MLILAASSRSPINLCSRSFTGDPFMLTQWKTGSPSNQSFKPSSCVTSVYSFINCMYLSGTRLVDLTSCVTERLWTCGAAKYPLDEILEPFSLNVDHESRLCQEIRTDDGLPYISHDETPSEVSSKTKIECQIASSISSYRWGVSRAQRQTLSLERSLDWWFGNYRHGAWVYKIFYICKFIV